MDIVPRSELSCSGVQQVELNPAPSPSVVRPERRHHQRDLDIIVAVRQSLTLKGNH